MKKITLIAILLYSASLSFAQVGIPMPTFGFSDGTGNFPNCVLPLGATYNATAGGEIYNASTSGGPNFPAMKLAATGHFFQIQTATAPGPVSYTIRGNIGTPATTWDGTFQLQQSVDGVNFTALPVLKTYTGAGAMPSSGNFVSETYTPDQSARYIRWYFTNKVQGANVALDNISIAAPGVGPGPTMLVNYNSNVVINNQDLYFNTNVGTPLTLDISINNHANTNDLVISNTTALTGSADYTLSTALPDTIAASTGGTNVLPLQVIFNPVANGTNNAVLTINSNDLNTPVFTINLHGIGGNLASEPTTTLSNLTFTGGNNYTKSYRLRGSFASSGQADGYLVVKRAGSSPNVPPTDGKEYMRGDTLGTDKVVGSFSSSEFVANNIVAGTNYYFAIYPYNGYDTFRNYAQAAVLTGNVSSISSMMPASEYNSINTANNTFISDLTNVINVAGRTKIYYSNYGGTMMKLFAATDTFAGKKVATCVYSGEKFVYTEPIAWGYFSREHTYCHDWMPTNPADGSGASPNNYERPEYNDQHHLFPTNQNDINAIRSNYPLGEVITIENSYLQGKLGIDINGNRVFEPRDAQKGRAARAMMYMAVAHNGLTNAAGTPQNWKFRYPISTSIPYAQDQNVIKKWNIQFPPDNWDMARNDFLDSLQGNRNPFVDHPEYACYIDFSTMSYISNPPIPCNTLGMEKNNGLGFFYVAPNPASEVITLYMSALDKYACQLSLFDMTGKEVFAKQTMLMSGNNQLQVPLNGLSNGVYMIKAAVNGNLYSQRIVVE